MSTRVLRKPLLLAAIATLIPAGANLNAQNQPPNQPPIHVFSICAKALPGKAAEYEKLMTGTFSKVAQVLVAEKQFSAWSLSRIVAPQGEVARCDYLSTHTVLGTPPEVGSLLTAERFKKAGVSMKPEEYYAARAAAVRPVSVSRLRGYSGTGALAKGDYYRVNYMKTRPGKAAEFRKFEHEVWMPLAREAAKGGHPVKGWRGAVLLYPSGTGIEHDHVTIDIFRDWESVWKPAGFSEEVIDKVHPGKKAADIFTPIPDLRDIVRRELYQVIEMVGTPPEPPSD
jgi:hypothetical protein